jgi:hypothetical protein
MQFSFSYPSSYTFVRKKKTATRILCVCVLVDFLLLLLFPLFKHKAFPIVCCVGLLLFTHTAALAQTHTHTHTESHIHKIDTYALISMSAYQQFAASAAGMALGNGTNSDKQALLSGFQFFLLLVVAAASYYFSLFVSVHAVGESTASLSAPIAAASNVISEVGNTIVRNVNRRRNHTQPGAVSYEEVEDGDDPFLGVNQPATGTHS